MQDELSRFGRRTYLTARRVAISVIGSTLVLIGLALLVLPGPGLLVIGAGLAVLAVEFAWARRTLTELRERASSAAGKASSMVRGQRRTPPAEPPAREPRGQVELHDLDEP